MCKHDEIIVATRVVLSKKLFLKTSQNSQENTCAGVYFLIKLQVSGEISKNTFFKKHLRTTGFSLPSQHLPVPSQQLKNTSLL